MEGLQKFTPAIRKILAVHHPGLKSSSISSICRQFSTSSHRCYLQKQSKVVVVDNSAIGKAAAATGRPVKIIHVYNKSGYGRLGDKVLVTIQHEKKQGYIVGCRQRQKPFVPKFDSNNVVLIDENGLPLGTRIKVPVPSMLRERDSPELLKILSLATKFV